jgi:hypothetical protein
MEIVSIPEVKMLLDSFNESCRDRPAYDSPKFAPVMITSNQYVHGYLISESDMREVIQFRKIIENWNNGNDL